MKDKMEDEQLTFGFENKIDITPDSPEIKFDQTGITEPSAENIKVITNEIKERYKNTKIFRIIVPYIGLYFIKAQNYTDVTEANAMVMTFIDERVESVGGNTEIDKLSEENKNKFMREMDEEISEISNKETLKRCVVYPASFSEKVDNGDIESGLMSLLLEKIMDISGWVDPIVEEV